MAAARKEEAAPAQAATADLVSYKGFDADWTCRGFQYEVGKTYEHDGPVVACESGFHGCEYPLHILRYYRPASSVYAVVRQGGTIDRHAEDSKIASSRLSVTVQIDIAGLVKAAIKYTLDRCTPAEGAHTDEANRSVSANGTRKSATASGYSGAATASGYSGAATASGYSGAATASGDYGAATASGYSGAATASGNYGAATASGHYGAATASGDYGAATASGNYGAATASGYSGAATASGHYGAATASGYSGAATASGDYGAATASGDYGAATASGYSGAATASGFNGRARGAIGCALFLVHRDADRKITHAKALIVGRDGIKPDTYYRLDDGGNAVEVAS